MCQNDKINQNQSECTTSQLLHIPTHLFAVSRRSVLRAAPLFLFDIFAFLCGAPQIRDRAAPHIDTFSLHYYAVPRRFVTGRPLSLSRLSILLLDQAQLCASSCSISRHLPPPAPHERGSNHSKLCPPINSPFLSDPISYAPRGVPTPSSPSGEMSPK
jgi:hypothetical protein